MRHVSNVTTGRHNGSGVLSYICYAHASKEFFRKRKRKKRVPTYYRVTVSREIFSSGDERALTYGYRGPRRHVFPIRVRVLRDCSSTMRFHRGSLVVLVVHSSHRCGVACAMLMIADIRRCAVDISLYQHYFFSRRERSGVSCITMGPNFQIVRARSLILACCTPGSRKGMDCSL